jgi:hypothetical protein
MANNSRSPAYIVWRYVANGHHHTQTLCVKLKPGFVPGEEPNVFLHDGTDQPATDALNALGTFYQPFFKTTAKFGLYEVWSQPEPEDEPVFIFAGTTDISGTDTGAEVTAAEQVFTFRTSVRGGMKLYFMEPTSAINASFDPPYSNPVFSDLSDFVCGATSPLFGRNNSPPIAPIRAVTKINDVLRRKYLTG